MSINATFVRVSADELDMLRAAVRRNRRAISDYLLEQTDKSRQLDIRKAWQGLHFLLNGDAWQKRGVLGSAIIGGREIGDDAGYGPARYLTVLQVTRIADEMHALSDANVLARYDAEQMNALGLYPGGWELPEHREWLREAFAQVRNFYIAAGEVGDAMLLFLH
jgi:hypothetical protein